MGEALQYLFLAALFVMLQVAIGGKKKKKKGPGGPPEQTAKKNKAAGNDKTRSQMDEKSAQASMRHEHAADDPCDSEAEPRIHLHRPDEQTMEQAGEGEDPCHAGAAPKRLTQEEEDESAGKDEQRAAFQSDVLRGVIMSEILTRPGERAAVRRMKRGR